MAFVFLKNAIKVAAMSAGVFVAPACFTLIAFIDTENKKEKHKEELNQRKPWARVGKPMIRADQPDFSITAMVSFNNGERLFPYYKGFKKYSLHQ